MEIRRLIMADMQAWKDKDYRRPLIIQGARQIGKTWVMKKFGAENYRHVAYFNFESSEELVKEFENTKDPHRLIDRLRLYTSVPIEPENTLIIFDEIQQSGKALNSLKYFSEEAPEYHIMAAGSLLGVALHRSEGFPVGKVEFLKMYPVSFQEYLATEWPDVCDFLNAFAWKEELPPVIYGRVWEAYRQYQICGGMPHVALASLEGAGNEEIEKRQQEILMSFFYDFSKHAPVSEFPKISAVWQSLPSQMSKENRKFIYKVVRPGARARDYEGAIAWLREAGLIYQIFCSTKPGLPLSAFDDLSAFKIYMFDTGMLRVLAGLSAEIFLTDNPGFSEFKGALTENAVLQGLVPQNRVLPRYWVSAGTAEVDFIIQNCMDVIPIEVKAGTNTSGKSLSVYINKYSPRMAAVVSAREYSVVDGPTKVIHIPLPLIDWLHRILAAAGSGEAEINL